MVWPQQSLTERVQISVEIWIFDNPFHKKGPVVGHLVAREYPTIRSSIFWWNEAVKVIEVMEVVLGFGVPWGCRGSKAWHITTEDFRVIQVLEFSFIFMFWKLVDEIKISKHQNFRNIFKQIIAYLCLSVRANSKNTFHCETPCI